MRVKTACDSRRYTQELYFTRDAMIIINAHVLRKSADHAYALLV